MLVRAVLGGRGGESPFAAMTAGAVSVSSMMTSTRSPMAVVPVVCAQVKSICRLALQTIKARRMVCATRPWASRLLGSAMLMPWLLSLPFAPSMFARSGR